jgi:hypothetical protein
MILDWTKILMAMTSRTTILMMATTTTIKPVILLFSPIFLPVSYHEPVCLIPMATQFYLWLCTYAT